MSFIRKNIIVNLMGGAILTILTIVITPIQINILGMDAYGVVGFIAILQMAFTAFDFGLSATITKELASDLSKDKRNSNDLIRTATAIYWFFAIILGAGILIFSGDIARRWFKAGAMDILLLQQSIEIIAIYLALRWPVALYVGILTGMQRMDWLNTVKVGATSFRLIGGVAVLLLYKSLLAFLMWTAFNAIIEVWAYWLACRHVHPNMPKLPKIVIPALRRVWRFSASMNVLAILTILIVQFDRLIISKLLTLEQLGVYSLAYSAAAIVTAITAAFGAATLPWFSATHGMGDLINLRKNYYAATRSLIYVAGFIVSIFIFFGFPLLSAWVNPTVALSARIPLALLAIGFWISATMACASQIAIASGYTRILLRISSVSAPLYFLILYLLVLGFGVNGAALAWLLLNLFYLVCLVPIIHKQILQLGFGVFFIQIIFPFILLSLGTFGVANYVVSILSAVSQAFEFLIFGSACALYLSIGFLLLGPDIKRMASSFLRTKMYKH